MENHVSGQSNKALSKPAHALDRDDLARQLEADIENGLTTVAAKQKLEQYGRNELDDGPGVQPVKILIRQVANAMMLVLILAMAVSFGIKSWIEGGVVCAIIVLNIVVGFLQEFQAEKTMDSLRQLSSPTALVIRNGESTAIPAKNVVPGDLVMIKDGDVIPADVRCSCCSSPSFVVANESHQLRMLYVSNLEVSEQLLTGESVPGTSAPTSWPPRPC